MDFMAILTSLVGMLAVIWLSWKVKKSRNINATLPPGPCGLPLVGYLPFLGTHLHRKFTELGEVYGPIYKLWLGNKFCVVVSSPSLVKEVVRDNDIVFANRDTSIAARAITYDANDIGWCPYGAKWRKLRKIFVGKMMSNASIDACYTLRKREIKNTIRDVYCNRIGKTVDIGELSTATSINVVQNMLWGASFELGQKGTNLGVELRKMLAELMVLLGTPNLSDIFPVLSWLDIQGIERKTKHILSWLEKIVYSAIEQRTNMVNDEQKDFLQFLLELKEHEDREKSITMIQLKALVMDIIVGGTDTSTTMVEWTMAELLQHQEVMRKVQQELAEVVGMFSSVEEFHLRELRYLDAVVKETLRLHPALPFLVPRSPSQSSTIGGYTVPKGTMVILNVWAIHRDPELWENPLEFKPERFLDDPEKFDYLGNNFKYMPFGSGRRMCAGIPLAERVLMFILASLLHSFEWKLPDGAELNLTEKFGIVIKKSQPLIAIPTPRLSNSELYY
ncbi:geraniol 8-hydroxylase-like [Pistacia vera]|uniref:geraniol 8-hydroxylase-like n=1 Tax=Pistacia vera TaxID=55513 RepID=UPI001262C1EC|nr:geraniol 8-hydroxylase-like [Pistacia vera]